VALDEGGLMTPENWVEVLSAVGCMGNQELYYLLGEWLVEQGILTVKEVMELAYKRGMTN
jgi:hypothetical protein